MRSAVTHRTHAEVIVEEYLDEQRRCTMTDDTYVTQGAWLLPAGRADAIDDVADQFERSAPAGADAFWNSLDLRRGAPIQAAAASFRMRTIERRAG